MHFVWLCKNLEIKLKEFGKWMATAHELNPDYRNNRLNNLLFFVLGALICASLCCQGLFSYLCPVLVRNQWHEFDPNGKKQWNQIAFFCIGWSEMYRLLLSVFSLPWTLLVRNEQHKSSPNEGKKLGYFENRASKPRTTKKNSQFFN